MKYERIDYVASAAGGSCSVRGIATAGALEIKIRNNQL